MSNTVPASGSESSKLSAALFESVPLPNPIWCRYWSEIIIDNCWRTDLENYARLLLNHTLSKFELQRLLCFQGPPGTGKTSLAKGFANYVAEERKKLEPHVPETRCLQVNADAWRSHWLGEGPKLVRRAFDLIELSARHYPTIVVIDEMERIAISRERTLGTSEPSDVITAVSQLLDSLDRLKEKHEVLVIATSNLSAGIDRAFLDRVDLVFPFQLPGTEARKKILERKLQILNVPDLQAGGKGLDKLAEQTKGLSGRDFSKLLLRASLLRMRTCPTAEGYTLETEDFERAIQEMRPGAPEGARLKRPKADGRIRQRNHH